MNDQPGRQDGAEPKQAEPDATPTVARVEDALLMGIREAANCVVSCADESPTSLSSETAEQAASAANVATAWTNIVKGLVGSLERFRLAHDLVKGGQAVTPPAGDEAERLNELVGQIRREAEQGASPTRIAQLIDSAGFVEG